MEKIQNDQDDNLKIITEAKENKVNNFNNIETGNTCVSLNVSVSNSDSDKIIDNNTKLIFLTASINSAKLFLKVFGLRAIYSIFKMIQINKTKKFIHLFTPENLFKNIFNLSNFRTSLSVSLLPFLYTILKKLFSLIYKKDSDYITFLSGFISAFISILVEEKTKLGNFIILYITVRVLHTVILTILKKYNILQNTGRLFDFLNFLFASVFFWSISFLNPSFTPITELIDSYANYRTLADKFDALTFRNTMRIV